MKKSKSKNTAKLEFLIFICSECGAVKKNFDEVSWYAGGQEGNDWHTGYRYAEVTFTCKCGQTFSIEVCDN